MPHMWAIRKLHLVNKAAPISPELTKERKDKIKRFRPAKCASHLVKLAVRSALDGYALRKTLFDCELQVYEALTSPNFGTR